MFIFSQAVNTTEGVKKEVRITSYAVDDPSYVYQFAQPILVSISGVSSNYKTIRYDFSHKIKERNQKIRKARKDIFKKIG